jgi:hypothetical protein
LSLLAEVSQLLASSGIRHAMIGAAALAVHGVARATADLDLLAVDDRCLESSFWSGLREREAMVDIRRGDHDDPLAGVVRVSRGEASIDLILGRAAWQADLLSRSETADLRDVSLPVVTAHDLILLKLYAGGPQDAWDIDQLLDVRPTLEAQVESLITALPADSRRLWRRILSERETSSTD